MIESPKRRSRAAHTPARSRRFAGGRPAPPPPAPLRIFALGPLQLFLGDRKVPVTDWPSRKAALVLKYLLAREPGRAVPKDEIMEALWPEHHPAKASQCLRAAISALRRALEPDLGSRMPSSYITSSGGRCMLTLGVAGFYDVPEFREGVRCATELERAGHDDAAAVAYQAALNLYRGDFLEEEPYADWAERRRERLREVFAQALLRFGNLCFARGDAARAADLAERALDADEAMEPAYRLLISSSARVGEWGRALRVYERYRVTMPEYGAPAPPSLQSLLGPIRQAGSEHV